MRRPILPIATLALLSPLAPACASLGGVPREELPDEPIAFVYHTEEEARHRAEDYQAERARAGEAPGPTPARRARAGRSDLVASEENLEEILSRVLGGGTGKGGDEQYLGRLALLHPRTGQLEVLAAARRGAIPLAWSQDRLRLLFSQPSPGDFQIYEYSRADDTVRVMTQGPPSHTQACYGADGRLVVAAVDTREQPLRSHIAISGPRGRAPFAALTPGPNDHSPACQPHGQGIAFVRESPPARSDLYFLDGSSLEDIGEGMPQPRRLAAGRHPSFSPDGEWLFYAAPHQRELRIWRIRTDGSGRAPVGRGIHHEARPAVSPDGRLVAYVAAEAPPRRHLYLRRVDGSGDRILFADGDGEFPVW